MRAFILFRLRQAMALCGAMATLLFLPAYGFTQSESVPAESVPSNATPLPDETISVVINVDVSNLQAPNNRLGSYQATLLWNPAVLQFVNITPALAPWNVPNLNASAVATGKLEWNDFQTGGSTGKVNILNVNLRVVGTAGAMDTLKLSFAELFTTTFRDIRNQLIIQNGTITVRSPNRAPVLSVIMNQTMNEGDTLDVSLSATDPDGGRITLAARNLPSFGSLTDNGDGTGRIRFTPDFFAAGVYQNIQVIATDDGTPALSDTVSFRLTVNNVNRAPQIRPPDAITLNEGDTLNITLSAEDPDGDSIVLRMSNLPAFGSFVDNRNGTGRLRLAPGRDDAGAYPLITLVATDNGVPNLSDSKQLDLTVIDRFPSLVCKTEIASPADSSVIFSDSVEVCVVTQVSGAVGELKKVCAVNGIPLVGLCVKVPVINGFNTIIATCTFTDSLSSCVSADTIRVDARIPDTLKCSLTLTPPNGTIICGDSVEVVGTLTITGGVPPYTKTCDVNGVLAIDTPTGFVLKMPCAPGNNTFIATCKVTDAGNRTATCVDSINVIRPAPPVCKLEIISPADSALITASTVKVTAVTSITGGVPPFTKTCNVNGVAATVTGDTLMATVPLTPGWNDLIATCTVTDSCGKAVVCSDTIRVESRIIDSLRCSLTLTPPSGTIICDDSVEVVGTLTITGGVPPYTKTCDVNGMPVRDTASGFILKLPVAPDNNTFIATCKVTDAGNRETVCRDTIRVIGLAPPVCTLEITTPADSAVTCDKKIKVTAVTSITGGVPPFTITCSINGVAATVSGNTIKATVPLARGWNNLIAMCTVTDSCGKTAVCRDTIRVQSVNDKTAPTCTFTQEPRSVTGTFFDNESGIAKIEALFLSNAELTVDPFVPGAKKVNFRLDGLGSEPHIGFDIEVTDLCGNSHICDPVLAYLSADDEDRRYTIGFRSVDRYLILDNHGLSEIQVDLNGHLFNLATTSGSNVRNRNTYFIPEEGNITIDLKPYLLESENVMRLEIQGQAGTGADFMLIDATHVIDHTLELQPIPMTFELSQNYPNPFNPSTTIRFGVPAHVAEGAAVQVRIYNTLGELVRTLVNEKMLPGQYAVEWNGQNDRGETVATGIYIYQLVTGGFKQTKKMSFVK